MDAPQFTNSQHKELTSYRSRNGRSFARPQQSQMVFNRAFNDYAKSPVPPTEYQPARQNCRDRGKPNGKD